MKTDNRIVVEKESPLTETFKKTAEEKEALKKAKAEYKKSLKTNGGKA
jgi:hypothetical protein